MDGVAVLEAAREDIRAARRARHQLLVRIREMQDLDLAAKNGYRSTKRLIEELWHLDGAESARLIKDAESLLGSVSMTGVPRPATLPATGAASEAGLVGEAHVRVIQKTMEHLERVEGIDLPALEASERTLATHAATRCRRRRWPGSRSG